MTAPTDPPTREADVLAQRLRIVLERLADHVEALRPSEVDTKVLVDGNSAAVIVAHVLGSARASVLGIACGLPVERDRAEEFASAGGTPEALGASLRAFADEAASALEATPEGRLGEVTTPPQAWLGLVPQQPMARRAAVLSTIGHASEHLGELMFIKDTLAARR